MAPPFRFFDLPGELQVQILGHVDARSMLACRKANLKLASTIDDDLGLRYKLELEIAGMVNGPREGGSIFERLSALRAFREAWARGEHPVQEVPLSRENVFNMTYYDPPAMATSMAHIERHQGEGSLKVYRPPGSFCGLASREDVFEGLSMHHVQEGLLNTGLKGYEVDIAQNLLVGWYGVFDQGPVS
ncbi:hypothetical protein GY45DRAFT_1330215 [Cubamyces sp. BRFM 1775]|nr:hypothetical protein GY45DRAFT_1330215 [Cubamyces sp. BRFM 1775]